MGELNVTYNVHEFPKGKVYITTGIGMGIATRRYTNGNGVEIISNLAFANVWANYIKRIHGLEYQLSVDRTVTYLSCQTKRENLIDTIVELIQVIFLTNYDNETFEQVKQKTIDNFKGAYKNAPFRGVYKIYEATEWNKEFYLQRLIDDIRDITFEQFMSLTKNLLVPSNCKKIGRAHV